jgi:low temperature requirement protein LtrA
VWLVLVVAPLVVALRSLGSLPVVVSHLVERVALFTMIVLGESVVELILAVDPAQSALGWFTSFAGFALICAFFWLYFQNATPAAERVLEHRSVAVLRDVITVGHYLIVLGLIGVAAGLGSAIEHADDAHLPFEALVALCGGVIVYHVAQVVIASRYGLPVRALLVLSPLAVIIPILVIVLGRDWAPWVIVVILVIDTLLHGLLGPGIVRKIPDNDEAPPVVAGSAS